MEPEPSNIGYLELLGFAPSHGSSNLMSSMHYKPCAYAEEGHAILINADGSSHASAPYPPISIILAEVGGDMLRITV